jgi:hypothetical protein
VTDRNCLWNAAELNAFVARCGDTPVAFAPPGSVNRQTPSLWEGLEPEDRSPDRSRSLADVICHEVVGIETVTANLTRLPLSLAVSAFDSETWCTLVLQSGSLQAAGPFQPLDSPLREWLLRALRAGRPIGTSRESWMGPIVEAGRIDELRTTDVNSIYGFVTGRCGLAESKLPLLVPADISESSNWLAPYLEVFSSSQWGCAVKSEPDGRALAAGVWQMNGFLDRSHEFAQSVEGKGRNRAGDYWHAIMHRRETDYSNAKYWVRRVGSHGIHGFLARDANHILAGCASAEAPHWRRALTDQGGQKWNGLAFVELCEQLAGGKDRELLLAARQIQLIEMALLLASTYHDAVA